MADCVFCRKLEEGTDLVFENDLFFGQFDRYPACPGHAEVLPRRHVESFFDLTADEWVSLRSAISEMVGVIESGGLQELYEGFLDGPLDPKSARFCRDMLAHPGVAKRPDGYNIGLNEGRAAGRTIDHVHIHILPRYHGDVENSAGGIRHIIKGMGNYTRTDDRDEE